MKNSIVSFFMIIFIAVFLIGCSANEKTTISKETNVDKAKFPEKPIKILVWSKAGAGVDVMARQAAKILEEELSQSIVVDNKIGGDGAAAMQTIKTLPADGYTIGVTTRSQMFSLNSDLKEQFSIEDFDYLSMNQGDPYALVVQAESGINSFEDLKKEIQKTDNFPIGGFGANSAHHIFAKDLAELAGLKYNWIPYEGGSEAITQLLGGHIKAVLTNVGQVTEQVKNKQVKILAVSTAERMNNLPDVKTFSELGYNELENSHWRGFYAKKGTPKEILDIYDDIFKRLSENEEWKEYLKTNSLTNDYLAHEEITTFVEHDSKEISEKLEK